MVDLYHAMQLMILNFRGYQYHDKINAELKEFSDNAGNQKLGAKNAIFSLRIKKNFEITFYDNSFQKKLKEFDDLIGDYRNICNLKNQTRLEKIKNLKRKRITADLYAKLSRESPI